MHRLHQDTREAYGAQQMWQSLNRHGNRCGRHRVARLRRVAGDRGTSPAAVYPHSANQIPGDDSDSRRLNQHFLATAKNLVWGVDFTFVWTLAGWLYVPVVLGFYSRLVVGWAMSHRQSPTVVIEA
jgi:transposase InsO family protein